MIEFLEKRSAILREFLIAMPEWFIRQHNERYYGILRQLFYPLRWSIYFFNSVVNTKLPALVWCYLTLNFTHLHYSCALQTGGVEPLQGISFHRERVKKLQQGVIQYFAYT